MMLPVPERLAVVEERLSNVTKRLEDVADKLDDIHDIVQQGKGAKWALVGVASMISGIAVAAFHKAFP